MKKTIKVLCLMLVLVMIFAVSYSCLIACNKECEHEFDKDGVCKLCNEKKCDITGSHTWHNGVCIYDETANADFVDYVSELTFNENSGRNWTKATVKNYIDGDTTHFTVPSSVVDVGLLKARYLAVNTPESTGQVEPYGKVASNFTKEKLSSASEIILESDNDNWNKDSTSTRYTVWVWYKPASGGEYRNLNLELLQEGLGRASNSEGNCYGEICGKALRQAQALNYRVHDDSVPDETFYYGDAIPLTLKELRSNIEDYNGKKVAFEGYVVLDNNNGVYVEEYDEISGISFGMYCYYGFTKNGALRDALLVGNHVRVVGNVTLFSGSYQVSGLAYRELHPDDPNNTKIVDNETRDPRWEEVSVDDFYKQIQVTIIGDDQHEDQVVTKDYAAFAQATSIYMTNLKVKSIFTTTNPASSSRGAMSITCTQEGSGREIVIRTGVLTDPNGIVPSQFISDGSDLPSGVVLKGFFEGKTFNVKGVVGYYSTDDDDKYGNSPYQINVFSLANFTFVG